MWVQSLVWEDPLEEGMAPVEVASGTILQYSAWRISRAEEPGGLQSTGSQRVKQVLKLLGMHACGPDISCFLWALHWYLTHFPASALQNVTHVLHEAFLYQTDRPLIPLKSEKIWHLLNYILCHMPLNMLYKPLLSQFSYRLELWAWLSWVSYEAATSCQPGQDSSVQFRSVTQSCPTLRPHELQHTNPPCPSPTPGVYSNSCPSSRWYHPAISSSVIPFSSCPQSLPASGSFPMSQLFAWGGQSMEFQLQHQSFQWTPRTDLL